MPPCDSQVSALSLVRSSHWSQFLTCTLPDRRPTIGETHIQVDLVASPGPPESVTMRVLVAKASYASLAFYGRSHTWLVYKSLSTFTMPEAGA
jgi:hypothetical protein